MMKSLSPNMTPIAIKLMVVVFSVLSLLTFLPNKAIAQDPCAGAVDVAKCNACESIKIAGGKCDDKMQSQKSVNNTAKTLIDILAIVAGTACLIVILIGGFRYIISGGDSNGVTGAKNTILYALIGLVVVVSARTLAVFVMGLIKK